MASVGLCGFYGKNNFGDDLMALHLEKILSSNGKNQVKLYSDAFSKNVNKFQNNGYLDNDIIVIGGGGIVDEKFWIFENGGIKKLIDSGKRIVFLNVNIVDYNLKNNFQEDLKKLNAVWWVRDLSSVHLLNNIGIGSNYLPDVSFSGNVLENKKYPEKANKKVLSVFLNAHAFTDEYQNQSIDGYLESQHYMRVLAKYFDWMESFGWEVHFIPCQTSGLADDRIPGGVIFSMMKSRHKTFWITRRLSPKHINRKIENSNLVVSSRYHSTTMSIAAGVKTLDITHHLKSKNFLDDLNLKELTVDYSSLSVAALIKATENLEYSTRFKENVEAYNKKSLEHWEKFKIDWQDFTKRVDQNVLGK